MKYTIISFINAKEREQYIKEYNKEQYIFIDAMEYIYNSLEQHNQEEISNEIIEKYSNIDNAIILHSIYNPTEEQYALNLCKALHNNNKKYINIISIPFEYSGYTEEYNKYKNELLNTNEENYVVNWNDYIKMIPQETNLNKLNNIVYKSMFKIAFNIIENKEIDQTIKIIINDENIISNLKESITKINYKEFNELEKVTNLFKQVNYIKENNCFLYTLNRAYLPGQNQLMTNGGIVSGAKIGGVAGSVAGGIVGNAVANNLNEVVQQTVNSIENESIKQLMNNNDICGYIINRTEEGFGFIPLTNNHKMITKIEDVEAHLDKFVSIKNEEIKELSLKKIAFNFNRRILKITLKSEKATPTLTLTIPTKSKEIKYQENNCKELINMIK